MSKITIFNPIEVPKGKEGETLQTFNHFANYFSKQTGYLSSTLHKAVEPNAQYALINISTWASKEDFLAALNTKEFEQVRQKAGSFTSHPTIYKTLEEN